ncbi:flagellar hook-associated protein FlgK [Bacillus suaedaesalsae]|uniref:Flagellar hook-associated protein 1 n=1 Tax=Bacillus suaedaesalsae TaxID=2810349 RepID=A0ABS2DKM5_9BACI|nr:flagellar hook-associated protein FlgK [Bacillus suaedaesalsae]MBM6619045.1 flagellar hook-associated protein FlgK [Bacillus suaedaesalsae]
MRSTFAGLETARRGMTAQQSALFVTGHNIANANTPGYSRQRVNFNQTEPYPAPAMNRPAIPGQIGTGVEGGTIERIRNSFLDTQYRGENTKMGYWSSRSEALGKMEEIMNEPSENGLSVTLDRFWQGLQDLSVQPEDPGARSVVLERGRAVSETFNYLSNSLSAIQKDFKDQVNISVEQINSIARQINNVNNQIASIEPHGYLPNDLYDERDRLIDQLSEMVDIKVTRVDSGGNPNEIAEGLMRIDIMDASGNPIGLLVDARNKSVNELGVKYGENENKELVETLTVGSKEINVNQFTVNGKFRSLIDSAGYVDKNGEPAGLYPDMIEELDALAQSYVMAFNTAHKQGKDLYGNDGIDFFDASTPPITAATMKLNPLMTKERIAASEDGTTGNGANAQALANVRDNVVMNGVATSVNAYYEGIIGEMAVKSQEAVRLAGNSDILRSSVEQKRQSESAVSIDEEMTNMIKFQHAYNAAARNITLVDEMLDKIINGMGTGGR